MASIASVYVDILPSTANIADGIKKALFGADNDVRQAARRWNREIEKELKDVDVKVDADATKAKKEIKQVEDGHYKAKIDVEVNDASLARAKAKIAAATSGAGGTLGGLAKGEALTAAVGLGPNIVPAIGSVVQAAGQLSGVLGVIPAAAGAAGLAMASLKIGMSGFSDAIKEVGDPAASRERHGLDELAFFDLKNPL